MRVFVLKNKNRTAKHGNVYRFLSKGQTVLWPMQDGAYLGVVGAWNLLFRFGMQPQYVTPGSIIMPAKGDLLFAVAEEDVFDADSRDGIDHWLANGGIVIAAGSLPAWQWLLPKAVRVEQARCEYPYAALGWKFGDHLPELVAPPQWSYGRLTGKGEVLSIGTLLAIRGERQTPQRAFATPLENAPALIRYQNFIFLNGNPFAAFQAWLQGQEDLGPWLQWRHRLFWLDEQVAFLGKVINEYALGPKKLVAQKFAGLPETTVVFRHDLDHSRDISYMEAECKAGVPGVYTVLRDNNTDFWVKTLRQVSGCEAGFHYNSAQYDRWLEKARVTLAALPKRPPRPNRREIAGDGLYRQVCWAKQKGIGIETLHRHSSFLIYPEWVDALDNVFEKESDVLGGSSLFRGQVLRWGCDRADGVHGLYGVFPDVQFPYWFPCKLAHAGLGGKPLRGWESASVMEIEPELFSQMLDHQVPGLQQRIITINYHPAHAKSSTFCRDGSFSWWKDILRIVEDRGIAVKTLRDLYALMDKTVTEPHESKLGQING